MQPLSSSALLDLWERGSALRSLDRALLALSAALPEVPPPSLADWPLGRRNQALLELHCCCFAASLQGWTGCASCGEKMEFDLEGGALLRQNSSLHEKVAFKGRQFRLPSSRDLAALGDETDSHAAAIRILRLCCLGDDEGREWVDQDVEEIGERMALADPLAQIMISLRCPGCRQESVETLDIASFVWEEIQARAKRLYWEVHSIASVYGWSETEILSLSPARRWHYLEMVKA